MPTMGAPKSAYELAMERLRKKDEEAGTTQASLTDDQKAEIAEVRTTYAARLAQEEIMQKAALMRMFDPAEREALAEEYRRTRARLNDERDAKLETIRRRQP
jgi:hypothetical protein